jgi:AraC-like DNA-binding protein
MLLLDTADIAPENRVDAFREVFDRASVPCHIEHLGPAERVRCRMHLWQFGRSNLFAADASGFRLVRTPLHLRMDGPAVVALAVQSNRTGHFSQFGADSLVGERQLMLDDLTEPYAFSWSGKGGSRAFQIPYDQLALSHEIVRSAAPRLPGSPLYDPVRNHLEWLTAQAEELAGDAGAVALGTATVELVRALLVSAAGKERPTCAAREETLLTRVLAYARSHLTEPDLGPARIAAAHNVSLRQLYKTCARGDMRLEQWLISQRLETARQQLASPVGHRRPIAATARACGFIDAGHFSRRFRETYGMAPRDWLRATAD